MLMQSAKFSVKMAVLIPSSQDPGKSILTLDAKADFQAPAFLCLYKRLNCVSQDTHGLGGGN